MIFLVPVWLKIVFFILGNAPTLLRVIFGIRDILADVGNAKDKEGIMAMCKEDIEAYKEHKNKEKLYRAVEEKKKAYLKAKRYDA